MAIQQGQTDAVLQTCYLRAAVRCCPAGKYLRPAVTRCIAGMLCQDNSEMLYCRQKSQARCEMYCRHAMSDQQCDGVLQAYYVIKAAQEREELQREGDILDGRIQTAEREVRGLEATLAKLNLVNTDMGNSFR